MTNLIGWGSALVLLVTLVEQLRAQFKSHSDVGVSPWLFVGQLVTSIGFIVYSVAKKDWVFVVTNTLIAFVAIAGQVLYFHLRRKKRKGPGSRQH